MITVVQNQDVYEVRFPYDPAVVSRVKNVPGRQYVPEHKYWIIPVDRLGFLIAQFKGTLYESQLQVYSAEHLNENATIDTTAASAIPDVDLSKVKLYVQEGGRVFDHQKDFMKFAIYRQQHGLYSGFIVADEMGCGKSLEAMNLALYNKKVNKIKHCLIVACVNSAKYNWIADIEKHTNGEYVPYLLGSRLKRDGTVRTDTGSLEKLEDLKCGHMYGKKDQPLLPFFLVINIEAFHYRQDRRYLIRERLTTLLNKGYIGMVILDEIHRNCFDYNTSILTDSGYMSIGDIVENNIRVNVASYDENNQTIEYKPIVNYFKNVNTSPLIELTIETHSGAKTIKCTSDHKFYTTNRGWVCAKDLDRFDNIVETSGSYLL